MRTDKLWLRNTSRYPDAEVWPLIKAAYEAVERSLTPMQVMPRIIVKLTNCRWAYRGRASWQEFHKPKNAGMGYAPRVEWRRILVRVGKPELFPARVNYWKFKEMPEYKCEDYRESIVMVTAHEMEHTLGTGGRKNGELRCEMTAQDALEFYRAHRAEIDGSIARVANRINERQATKAARAADAKRPEVVAAKKLQMAEAALAKWTRKQKLATGKVKKYARMVKRLNCKLTIQKVEPLALAATVSEDQARRDFVDSESESIRSEIIAEHDGKI